MVKEDSVRLSPGILADIAAIGRISVVPTILEVICRTTGMGFAAVARVTDQKWVVCSVRDEIKFGLEPGGELQLETTICHEIRQSGQGIIIDHVAEDPNFCGHHTPAMYGFQSYISIPIIKKDGSFFGTLCAIDPRPAKLNTPEIIGMFKLYAELISFHLGALEEMAASEKLLHEEQKTAELRDQFIAILGHDLRNPVGAVKNVAQLMQRGQFDEARNKQFARILLNSSHRIIGLIDNVLDFARGQLGDGIVVKQQPEPLEKLLGHVIEELQLAWPERQIVSKFALPDQVFCDGKRIAQLFSNLLGNAITHGKPDEPIEVIAEAKNNVFVLTVTNGGQPISDQNIKQLFKPFSRGSVKQGQGLGLGLFIASEIAQAHGGTIDVLSADNKISFTFRMPV